MTYLVRRFFASYIDALLVTILVLLLYILSASLSGMSVFKEGEPLPDFLLICQIICYLFYSFVAEFLFRKSVGKILFRFEIDGFVGNHRKRFVQVLRRTLSRLIPLDQISILFNEEYNMWHDKISKTKVVDVLKR